jgi:hypothetical protein
MDGAPHRAINESCRSGYDPVADVRSEPLLVSALRPIPAVKTTSLVRQFLPLVQGVDLRPANGKFSPKADFPLTAQFASFSDSNVNV